MFPSRYLLVKIAQIPQSDFPYTAAGKATRPCSVTTNEWQIAFLVMENLKEETVPGQASSRELYDRCLRPEGLVRKQVARTDTRGRRVAPSGTKQLSNSQFCLTPVTRAIDATAGHRN